MKIIMLCQTNNCRAKREKGDNIFCNQCRLQWIIHCANQGHGISAKYHVIDRGYKLGLYDDWLEFAIGGTN